jgi:hypothetical protein
VRRQLGVAHRVLDILVTEVSLQRAGVVASIASAQHVRVDGKGHASTLADAAEEGIEALGRHGSTALGREHVRGWLLLTLQTQCVQLIALQRMDARRPVLDPAHVQAASGQLDLMPLRSHSSEARSPCRKASSPSKQQ